MFGCHAQPTLSKTCQLKFYCHVFGSHCFMWCAKIRFIQASLDNIRDTLLYFHHLMWNDGVSRWKCFAGKHGKAKFTNRLVHVTSCYFEEKKIEYSIKWRWILWMSCNELLKTSVQKLTRPIFAHRTVCWNMFYFFILQLIFRH